MQFFCKIFTKFAGTNIKFGKVLIFVENRDIISYIFGDKLET